MTELPPSVPARAPHRTSLLILLVALTLGVALLGLAIGMSLRDNTQPPTPTPQIPGITALVPPEPLPDFTLTNNLGQETSLSDFAGSYVVMFFGFTHCPDFCPLTLANYAQVKQLMGDAGERVSFVFVSVDGERDTPEVLNAYVPRFDPSFIGLTGTEEDVRGLGVPYGLQFTLNKESPDDTEYSVEHSTLGYVIDPQRNLHTLISYNTDAQFTADYLTMLVASAPQ
jgi:protein SCO1/2